MESTILSKLTDSRLIAVELALSLSIERSCLNEPGASSAFWLARTVALKAVRHEMKRRGIGRDHGVGSSLCEEAPEEPTKVGY